MIAVPMTSTPQSSGGFTPKTSRSRGLAPAALATTTTAANARMFRRQTFAPSDSISFSVVSFIRFRSCGGKTRSKPSDKKRIRRIFIRQGDYRGYILAIVKRFRLRIGKICKFVGIYFNCENDTKLILDYNHLFVPEQFGI